MSDCIREEYRIFSFAAFAVKTSIEHQQLRENLMSALPCFFRRNESINFLLLELNEGIPLARQYTAAYIGLQSGFQIGAQSGGIKTL